MGSDASSFGRCWRMGSPMYASWGGSDRWWNPRSEEMDMGARRWIITPVLWGFWGTSASAETAAPEQTIKPFVWAQGGGYGGPVFRASTVDPRSEQIGVSGDFFSRATVGVGFWEGEGTLLPGWGNDTSGLDFAVTIGGWFRLDSAIPGTEESMGRAFGGTIALVENTDAGRLQATMVDIGLRQSLERLGAVRQSADGANLQQFSVGIAEQVQLFGEHYIGPAARFHWGTDALPTGFSLGVELSTAL